MDYNNLWMPYKGGFDADPEAEEYLKSLKEQRLESLSDMKRQKTDTLIQAFEGDLDAQEESKEWFGVYAVDFFSRMWDEAFTESHSYSKELPDLLSVSNTEST